MGTKLCRGFQQVVYRGLPTQREVTIEFRTSQVDVVMQQNDERQYRPWDRRGSFCRPAGAFKIISRLSDFRGLTPPGYGLSPLRGCEHRHECLNILAVRRKPTVKVGQRKTRESPGRGGRHLRQ